MLAQQNTVRTAAWLTARDHINTWLRVLIVDTGDMVTDTNDVIVDTVDKIADTGYVTYRSVLKLSRKVYLRLFVGMCRLLNRGRVGRGIDAMAHSGNISFAFTRLQL